MGLPHCRGMVEGPITLPILVIPLFLSLEWKNSRSSQLPGKGWYPVAMSSDFQSRVAPSTPWPMGQGRIAPQYFCWEKGVHGGPESEQ